MNIRRSAKTGGLMQQPLAFEGGPHSKQMIGPDGAVAALIDFGRIVGVVVEQLQEKGRDEAALSAPKT
ncbi:MAG: hypothetical protein Q9184_004167 [Pyrenodesmia sp. 2 TL-2023]